MRFLTFSSRPEGPKCLKYQNVPNLRSFWAIGKPWERFQSWVIKVYFIPLLFDHTVFPSRELKILKILTQMSQHQFVNIPPFQVRHDILQLEDIQASQHNCQTKIINNFYFFLLPIKMPIIQKKYLKVIYKSWFFRVASKTTKAIRRGFTQVGM